MISSNETNNPKVSIIIPVYNSEEYLTDCLKSVINQTLQEIEIILVDDGSTDDSPNICDEFRNTDNRIVVIHQENKGICGARNAGLKKARGEYVGFCDNDDYVSPECFQLAYDCAKKNNADVVRFRRKHTIIGRHGKITTRYQEYNDHLVRVNDWDDYMDIISKTGYGIWVGIYKRETIIENSVFFDTRVKYGFEDHIFSGTIYRYAKIVYLLNKELYEWIQRASHSASMKKGYDIFMNRFEGMVIWKSAEDALYREVTDHNNSHENRQYDYMGIAFEEITNSGLVGKEAQKAMEYAKENLNFIPKKHANFEESLINHDRIRAYMALRYYKVAKRKIGQIVHKAIGDRG